MCMKKAHTQTARRLRYVGEEVILNACTFQQIQHRGLQNSTVAKVRFSSLVLGSFHQLISDNNLTTELEPTVI